MQVPLRVPGKPNNHDQNRIQFTSPNHIPKDAGFRVHKYTSSQFETKELKALVVSAEIQDRIKTLKRKRLRTSPPIPARPDEQLFQRRLLVSDSRLENGHELRIRTGLPSAARTTPPEEQFFDRGPARLADLDPDKKGDAFERIHPDGWGKILPKQWVEEDFSDADSKDTEETRSVYSQDNGEEDRHRWDPRDLRTRPKTQNQPIKLVDSVVAYHVPEEDVRIQQFKNGFNIDGEIVSRPDATARPPLAILADRPCSPRARQHALPHANSDSRETQRFRSFHNCRTTLRDLLTENEVKPPGDPWQLPGQTQQFYRYNVDGIIDADLVGELRQYAGAGHSQDIMPVIMAADDRNRAPSLSQLEQAQSPLIPLPLKIRHRETKDPRETVSEFTSASGTKSNQTQTEAVPSLPTDSFWNIDAPTYQSSNRGNEFKQPIRTGAADSQSGLRSMPLVETSRSSPSPRSSWSSVVLQSEAQDEEMPTGPHRGAEDPENKAPDRESRACLFEQHESVKTPAAEVGSQTITPVYYFGSRQSPELNAKLEDGGLLGLDVHLWDTRNHKPGAITSLNSQDHEDLDADRALKTEIEDLLDMYFQPSDLDQNETLNEPEHEPDQKKRQQCRSQNQNPVIVQHYSGCSIKDDYLPATIHSTGSGPRFGFDSNVRSDSGSKSTATITRSPRELHRIEELDDDYQTPSIQQRSHHIAGKGLERVRTGSISNSLDLSPTTPITLSPQRRRARDIDPGSNTTSRSRHRDRDLRVFDHTDLKNPAMACTGRPGIVNNRSKPSDAAVPNFPQPAKDSSTPFGPTSSSSSPSSPSSRSVIHASAVTPYRNRANGAKITSFPSVSEDRVARPIMVPVTFLNRDGRNWI
ncbi:hypothetical protein A1O1_00261 [Capronia coronata CBS 617.96]|uniref:Uncharacterized protein n=1 Tax=Capronia coronata CBS 617.96 TaxID=1182541 RepID=W9YQD9_9EURO|nr:uncharacterized protein A1O1_00261 [Capronia coronata CBS 617.96]EXJ95142.1 hypothetical protein A1O1_00261 [Capronia coronata CBS 617.96]